ncbi:hypothetical protein BDZ97DRAFT_1810111 [Flammula alnicola]|nr:hypothetical protein BDZ97DRAFT_1810111 [Flammula alnicola]
MSGPDPISLIALLVSLVALFSALLQVAQQYLSTASDIRHCSACTVGGWYEQSRRRFIWSELRFEVSFTTPIIRIGILRSSIYAPPDASLSLGAPDASLSRGVPDASLSHAAQYIFHRPNLKDKPDQYTQSQNPWFLDLTGTRDKARCTWLSLLNAMSTIQLQVDIDERTLSFDFMPDGIKKPLAQMDRKSFLTIMSLFQVSWHEGWRKESASGGGGGTRWDTPTGAGPYCEVTSRNLLNFGTVISYQASKDQPPMQFSIVSEKARSAMFNCFDLGFHIVLTHSAEEIYRSTKDLAGETAANTIKSLYVANDGWSPGLAEAIMCFAEPEMPKAIQRGTDHFISIFSARSIASMFNDRPVVRLLIGEVVKDRTPDEKQFAKWANDYISSSSSSLALLEALQNFREIDHHPILWSDARKCLALIKTLDEQSSAFYPFLSPNQSKLDVQREFAQLQVQFGCKLLEQTNNLANHSPGGFWRDFISSAVATNYVKICSALGEKYPNWSEKRRHDFVINRFMRGVLWGIHNMNRPGNQPTDERLLECSLSSRWLSDASTLWMD